MNAVINLNDTVKVKLSDRGLEIHRESWDKIMCNSPYQNSYIPPSVDEEGYSYFQLWDLMHIFGSKVSMGLKLPFKDTDIIKVYTS